MISRPKARSRHNSYKIGDGFLRQQLKRVENRTHRADSRLTMKSQLIAIVAAVLVVGCGGPPKDIREAARQGNIEAVKQYLADGVDVNAKDDWGKTPLHSTAEMRRKEIAELLIANGADVNAKDSWGITPLHYATANDQKETVELLIAEGAEVNVKDKYDGTPLHSATANDHKEIAKLLIAEGADVNAKNLDGDTPLDYAGGETADLLRKHGGKTAKELRAEGK